MSFLLDPFLSVILGMIVFALSNFFQWKSRITFIVGGIAAVLATLYSVILYLDWLPSDVIILDNLRWLVRVIPQKGSAIMLHANVTGIDKATFPVPLVVLFYALYPLWVYLGFNISKNLHAPREPTPTSMFGTRRFRTIGLFMIEAGPLLTLYGMTMPSDYGGQVGFIIANFAIWTTIIGIFLVTYPKSERDQWWLGPSKSE
jgi:hypothetical protein